MAQHQHKTVTCSLQALLSFLSLAVRKSVGRVWERGYKTVMKDKVDKLFIFTNGSKPILTSCVVLASLPSLGPVVREKLGLGDLVMCNDAR